MIQMKIGIYGLGFVGNHIAKLLDKHHTLFAHDPDKAMLIANDTELDLAIICTPTPPYKDGSCDMSTVYAAASQTPAPLVLIKSTVPPGTTAALSGLYPNKTFVFSPEYMGESKYYTPPEYPSPNDSRQHQFMIVGGPAHACSRIIDIFLPIMGPTCRFRSMSSQEAELVKYAENAFFAMKVTFANELRTIAEHLGLNYHNVREGWIDDPRVGPMHSAAFKDARGFSGKCLPKDISALAAFCRDQGIPSKLLEAVIDTNDGD